VLSHDGVGIVAAAMVSDPVSLVQEWLTWAGSQEPRLAQGRKCEE